MQMLHIFLFFLSSNINIPITTKLTLHYNSLTFLRYIWKKKSTQCPVMTWFITVCSFKAVKFQYILKKSKSQINNYWCGINVFLWFSFFAVIVRVKIYLIKKTVDNTVQIMRSWQNYNSKLKLLKPVLNCWGLIVSF